MSPPFGWAPFDNLGTVYRANPLYLLQDDLGQRGQIVRIEFIEVESRRLPVFMKAKTQIEIWLGLQPFDVDQRLLGLGLAKLAVQVQSVGVLPAVLNEPFGIEARAQPKVQAGRPTVLAQELPGG